MEEEFDNDTSSTSETTGNSRTRSLYEVLNNGKLYNAVADWCEEEEPELRSSVGTSVIGIHPK